LLRYQNNARNGSETCFGFKYTVTHPQFESLRTFFPLLIFWQIGFFYAAVLVDWWRWWARQRRPSWAIWRARGTMEEEGLGSTSASSGSSRSGALRRFWSTGYRFSTTPKSDPVSARMVSFELLCCSVEMGLCGFWWLGVWF
jgi:hypothetical protein